MIYNDDQLANEQIFAKIAQEYKNKLKSNQPLDDKITFTNPELKNNTSYNDQVQSVVSLLEKSEGYLVMIKNFLPTTRYNGKIDIATLEQAIKQTKSNKQHILNLTPDFNPTILATQYVPTCYNYHHCFSEFCWCQMDLLRALLLLRLIRGYSDNETSLHQIVITELDIMQIPLKLAT